MKKLSLKKLNMRGHTHIWVPILVVLVIGAIGVYIATISLGHAATGVVPYSGGDDGCGGNATHYYTSSDYATHNYSYTHVGRTNYGGGSYCKCSNGRYVPYVAIPDPASTSNGHCYYSTYTGGDDGCGANADHYYGSIHVSRSIVSLSVCKCTNGRIIPYSAQPYAGSTNTGCTTTSSGGGGTPQPTTAYYKPVRNAVSYSAYQTGKYSLSNYMVVTRIDQGVDFDGTGSVYAVGNGSVVVSTSSDCGWPGCNIVVYKLTSGPAAGKYIYVAEDCHPKVGVGQSVNTNTVICTSFPGNDGIEMGWSSGSTTAAASGWYHSGVACSGNGAASYYGQNFNSLLVSLGEPSAYKQSGCAVEGYVSGYPNW